MGWGDSYPNNFGNNQELSVIPLSNFLLEIYYDGISECGDSTQVCMGWYLPPILILFPHPYVLSLPYTHSLYTMLNCTCLFKSLFCFHHLEVTRFYLSFKVFHATCWDSIKLACMYCTCTNSDHFALLESYYKVHLTMHCTLETPVKSAKAKREWSPSHLLYDLWAF